MEAHSHWANDTMRAVGLRPYQNAFSFPAALVLVSLLLGSACLLLLRRVAGALSDPLSGGALILAGFCVATAVVGSHYLGRRVTLPQNRWLQILFRWGPALAVAMFAVALSIKGTSKPALALYLVLIVGGEFFAERGRWIFGKSRPSLRGFRWGQSAAPNEGTRPSSVPAELPEPISRLAEESSAVAQLEPEIETESPEWEEDPAGEALDELPEAMLEGAWQQVTRARTPDGEVVTGWVKAEFQPGERTAVLHVAFCPPLSEAPQIELEQLSGPAARIKAAQVLPQGARLEIRLNLAASEAETLMVAFVATPPHSDT